MSTVAIPPELLWPGHQLLKSIGVSATDEQLLDLLLRMGIVILTSHPEALGLLDKSLVYGPFLETQGVGCGVTKSPALLAFRDAVSRGLGQRVGMAGTIRLAAAAGALSLGLPVFLR